MEKVNYFWFALYYLLYVRLPVKLYLGPHHILKIVRTTCFESEAVRCYSRMSLEWGLLSLFA